MAIEVFPGSASNSGTTAIASLSVTVPSSTLGDVSFIFVCTRATASTSALVAPAGWTPVFDGAAGGIISSASNISRGQVYYRAWQPGDPTSVSFSVASGTSRWTLMPLRVTGLDTTSPVYTSAYTRYSSTAANSSFSAPSLTAIADSPLLVTFLGIATNTGGLPTWQTAPSGMSVRFIESSQATGSTNSTGLVATVLVGAGATGARSGSVDKIMFPIGFSMLLRQAPPKTGTITRRKGGTPVQIRYKGQAA